MIPLGVSGIILQRGHRRVSARIGIHDKRAQEQTDTFKQGEANIKDAEDCNYDWALTHRFRSG